jgi:hypothetical protein
MGFEIENNLVAAVRYDGATQTILAQYGIVSVVRNGVGDYEINTLESLGDAEDTTSCVVEAAAGALAINVEKTLQNQWTVRGWLNDDGSAPAEIRFHVKIFRIATG